MRIERIHAGPRASPVVLSHSESAEVTRTAQIGNVSKKLLARLDSTIFGRIVVQLLFNSIIMRCFSSLVYEPEVHKVLRGRVFTEPAIDGGAQSGHYSLLLSRIAPAVISIEPIPTNYFLIKCLLRLYHVRNVTQLNAAIGQEAGIAVLHLAPNLKNASLREGEAYSGKEFLVPTVQLSSVVTSVGKVGFIKLDVEGAEIEILRDAAKVMDSVYEWLIEVHDPTQYQPINAILSSHGYCVAKLGYDHLHAFRPGLARTLS